MKILRMTAPDGTYEEGPLDVLGPKFVAVGGVASGYTLGDPTVAVAASQLTVDPAKAGEIEKRAQEIEALGFALPRPWFAPGTRMIQVGIDTYSAKYAEWGKRPLAEDVLRETAQRIREEDRRSFVLPLRDLIMAADGSIGREGGPARRIEYPAWEQIYSQVRASGAVPDGRRLLEALPPHLRAQIWNDRIKQLDPGKEIKVGVRKGEKGEWTIYRLVGPTFPEDGNGAEAAEAAARAIQGHGLRGHVVYDPGSTTIKFEAAHMESPLTLDPTVGDIFRAGIQGSTNDAGNGAFVVRPFVGRIICINCTVADAYGAGVRKTHRGSMEAAVAGITDAADTALRVLPAFAEDWKILRNTAINSIPWEDKIGKLSLDTQAILASDPSAPNVIRALVESKRISAKVGQDAMVQALLSAFRTEPGETLADLINAVTRAAHEKVPIHVRPELEESAGKLMPWLADLA